MKIKVNVAKLPNPPLPPTKSVRVIGRPKIPYETRDYERDEMVERRKRAAEGRARTMKNGYTPEQENLIIEMYKQGASAEVIAEKLGRTKVAIKQKIEKMRKKRNFEREAPLQRRYTKRKPEIEIVRRNHYTKAQDDVIRVMKADGKTYKEIADQIGKSPDAVRGRWRRM